MTLSVPALAVWLALQPVPSGPPLHSEIDRLVAAAQPNYAKQAAPLANDAEFLRRVYLDLTGTIPTATEARAFLADRDPKKREKLIDRLLASHGYARRMAQHFDVTFMERRPDAKVTRAAWEAYLRESFAANKPYNQLVREILAADGTDPKNRAPAKFFLDRVLEPNVVAKDVGRVFLGRNLQCAQCHDHPLVDDYKQDQYYGLLAFLNRTYLFPNANDPAAVIGEKADGEVQFVSVFDAAKKQKGTPPRVPDMQPIEDAKPEKGKEYKAAPTDKVRGVPAYSRREQLARAVTDPRNKAFARTAVNRLWALMLGRGLVHPLDMDHSANPPTHPQLLELLTKRFAASRYDVKYLLREIALSQTYQRSSEPPPGEVPEHRFLVAELKPLSPEQLAYAVLQATGYADSERLALGAKLTDVALDAKLSSNVDPFRRTFGAKAGEPEAFSANLNQTLFLKHGGTVRNLLSPRNGNVTDRVAKQADPDTAADELFLSVLTRLPTAEERADVAEMLKGSANRPQAVAEVVWALVASAEFRFNH